MTTEELLKKIIVSNYGTLTKFADAAGLPYTSLMSVLNRGVQNSGIKNVSKICATLGISTDDLCEGRIVFVPREGQRVNLEGVLAFLRAQLDAGQVDLDAEPVDGEAASLACLLLDSVTDVIRKTRKGRQS